MSTSTHTGVVGLSVSYFLLCDQAVCECLDSHRWDRRSVPPCRSVVEISRITAVQFYVCSCGWNSSSVYTLLGHTLISVLSMVARACQSWVQRRFIQIQPSNVVRDSRQQPAVAADSFSSWRCWRRFRLWGCARLIVHSHTSRCLQGMRWILGDHAVI